MMYIQVRKELFICVWGKQNARPSDQGGQHDLFQSFNH